MATENPIKTVGIQPDAFIAHEFSGAPPEILGGERVIKPIVSTLGLSYAEASSHQDKLLGEYDRWESSYLAGKKSESKKLSDKFMSTYGFSPESLQQARLNRRKTEGLDK